MKRWISDPLLRKTWLLALATGAAVAVLAVVLGRPDSYHQGAAACMGVMIGAAAMRLWTWRQKP